MNEKYKIAFVSFFEVFPINFGSSVVCASLFNNFKTKQKKYFQLSNKDERDKKIINIGHVNNSLGKLLAIPRLFIKLKSYLNFNRNFLIVEGPSWAGYSFLIILLIKIFHKKVVIIYKSHSIEYEIRKKNSNFFIYTLTKYFEKKIFHIANFSTSVSRVEQKKIYKIYNTKTILFPNTIDYKKIRNSKKSKYQYIVFSGSLEYKPNKESFEILTKLIMPRVLKIYPKLKLILLGNDQVSFNENWIICKRVTKKKYLQIISKSIAMVVPSNESYGTKVKIIEALAYAVPVIASKLGARGIEIINEKQPIVCAKNEDITKKLIKVIKYNKKYRSYAKKFSSFYINNHDIKKNLTKFKNSIKIYDK